MMQRINSLTQKRCGGKDAEGDSQKNFHLDCTYSVPGDHRLIQIPMQRAPIHCKFFYTETGRLFVYNLRNSHRLLHLEKKMLPFLEQR